MTHDPLDPNHNIKIGFCAAVLVCAGVVMLLVPVFSETFAHAAVMGSVLIGLGVLVGAMLYTRIRAPRSAGAMRLRAIVVVLLCGGVGGFVALIQVLQMRQAWRLSSVGVGAEARIESRQRRGGRGASGYDYELVYAGRRGRVSHEASFPEGATVAVLYDPDDPAAVAFGAPGDSAISLYLYEVGGLSALMMLGVCFGAAGLGVQQSRRLIHSFRSGRGS